MFYDTHAHLDFPDFKDQLETIVQRAASSGVTRIITIGTTLESSRRAVEIAEKFPGVFAAVGWHPSYVSSAPDEIPAEFHKLASHEKVVAIGETGLDYSRPPSKSGQSAEDDEIYKTRQKKLFEQQLELAREFKLNVIVHQRDSFEDTLAVLKPYASAVRAVFHCFSGTPEERSRISEFNALVSYTGIVTFKNAGGVRESLKATPLSGLMLETDCPFLAPVPHRGQRCEPAYVADTARFIAEQKGCSLEELSEKTCQTAQRFFPKLS